MNNEQNEQYVREQCPNLEVHYAPEGTHKWLLAFDNTNPHSTSIMAQTGDEMWQRAYESLRRRETAQ